MCNKISKRSKKIVLVAHCLLNANSKVEGLEEFDAILKELMIFLINNSFGIIQLPCPELTSHGIKRWGKVREQYNNPFYRQHCEKIMEPIIDQLKDYLENDYKISGLIGVEKSPSCGVKESCSAKKWGGEISVNNIHNLDKTTIVNKNGVFIEFLRKEFKNRNFNIPFFGIDELNITNSIKTLEKNLL
jgi:predicted secreted protein